MTVPFPPIITWASSTNDATPDFNIDLPNGASDSTDAAAGDVLVMQYSTDSGFNWTSYFSASLSSGDIIASSLSETASALANGTYVFRSRLERSSVPSEWSNYIDVTILVGLRSPFRLRLHA